MRAFRSALDPGLTDFPSDVLVLAVVVDVLRATTTLVHAFAHGARSARAFASLKEARAFAAGSDVLLCGESGGLKPEGFDRGNSPSEFSSSDVAGRDLVLATTNGAPALARTAGAAHQFVAAFVNVSVACDALGAIARRNAERACEVRLVGAGNGGVPAAEDDALVGVLAARLLASPGFALEGEDPRPRCALAGFDPASGVVRGDADLPEFLLATEHGQTLVALGFGRDVRDAAQVDAFTRLPFGRGGTIGPGLDRSQAVEIPLF